MPLTMVMSYHRIMPQLVDCCGWETFSIPGLPNTNLIPRFVDVTILQTKVRLTTEMRVLATTSLVEYLRRYLRVDH